MDDAKRARLMDAAIEEFAERGIESASYNKIIERSGLSKGTVYYYFDNKDSLLLTVLDEICDRFNRAMGDLELPDTKEEYWAAVREYDGRAIRFFLENPRLWRVVSWISKDAPLIEQLQAVRGRVTRFMDDLIVRGREIGTVRDDIPLEIVQRLMHELGKVLAAGMQEESETGSELPSQSGRGCEKEQVKIEEFIATMHDLSKRILTPKEDFACFSRF